VITSENYADKFCDLLLKLGYTHCFYLAGGNIMHLLNSVSSRFTCIPVVHEVTAGIAVEYFNESNLNSAKKAFVLVTAGPGLTNLMTAIAGAYLESRELLVVGGQVKSQDLKTNLLRQNGIQEIDGISLVESLTTDRFQIDRPYNLKTLEARISPDKSSRKGPIFVEFCLDIQAFTGEPIERLPTIQRTAFKLDQTFEDLFDKLENYSRPVLLLGGGVSRSFASTNSSRIESLPFPVMTTWNGCDRIDSRAANFMGRPNTWGQRFANIVLQQADLIVAVGTRLGLQQTGFNWQGFAPEADIVHVDIDSNELVRSNLRTNFKFRADADFFLEGFLRKVESSETFPGVEKWFAFAAEVKKLCPVSEEINGSKMGYWNPYDFLLELSRRLKPGDSVIPSSSGGAETVTMQTLQQIAGTTVITDKGLASMGYGLAGAIGAAVKTGSRVLHIEGDGGFAQNLQDLGTVAKNQLPIKTFIFSNKGYASIRMTQKSYFNGNYVGCDEDTGLGLPNWKLLFQAYGIPLLEINPGTAFSDEIIELLDNDKPHGFIVNVHPEQTYFPKITSQILADGSMQSNPLHLMTPELDAGVSQAVFKYLSV
jgi:acetolactate synthase-1/2/3 large subunit